VHSSRRVARLKAKGEVRAEAKAAIADRAVGYVRVSTDEQAAHGHGLEAQERAIRAFADSQGYALGGIFADPGISGSVRPADRPGFSELLRSSDGTSVLLVWKFDRLARQLLYAVTTVNELAEHHDIVIRSVTEPIDTSTPMGRTIFAVLAGMAEQERQAITERTFAGRREKAGEGGFAGGATPYGYRRDRGGGLAIDEAEALVVKRVFTLRGEGLSYEAIAATLNGQAIMTRRGKAWRGSGIAYILDNPKYRGAVEYLFRWGGADAHVLREGQHPAIAPTPQI